MALTANAQDYSALTQDNHPRLFLVDSDFGQIKERVQNDSDDALTALHRLIMKRASSVGLDPSLIEYSFDEGGKRLLETSRRALERIFLCSYAYRYTGSRQFLDHATSDLESVCSFSSWNAENHFLDAAEMALAVGIGYDWLYDELPSETKQRILTALERYAFTPSEDEDIAWFYYSEGNWNQVCNAGVVTAALATYEKCDTTARRIIEEGIRTNRISMQTIYSPSGCYAEGPGYWSYGNIFQAVLLSALESCFGSDSELSLIEGFLETALYKQLTYRPFGNIFNYSDNLDERKPAYALWYFADRFKDCGLLSDEEQLLADGKYEDSSEVRLLPLLMRYALNVTSDRGVENVTIPHIYVNYGTESRYDDTPLVIFRKEESYLGIKGGSPTTNHAHMDGGSFVYDAFGRSWAIDPDRAPYSELESAASGIGGDFWDMSQNSVRWQFPAIGNKWHNTITINDKEFNVKGKAEIIEIIDSKEYKGAELNLSSLFGPEVSRTTRRISIDSGDCLSVEDRVTAGQGKGPVLRWTFVTPAKVTVGRRDIELENEGTMVRLRTKANVRVSYKEFPSGNDSYRICGFEAKLRPGKETVFRTKISR